MNAAMSARRGGIVLADISGYTEFIAATELEHSKEILAELLEQITFSVKHELSVAQIEGDALFFLADVVEPGTFEALEVAFVAFHRRLRDIASSTSCPCRACGDVRALTLKFIVHLGEYVRQQVAGTDHFVGSDVVLAHRLLKNAVPSHEYILATAPALAVLPEPSRAAFALSEERYDHIGAVAIGYRELSHLRAGAASYERHPVDAGRADLAGAREYETPADELWRWLDARPHRMTWLSLPLWLEWDVRSAEMGPGARGGLLGAELHCYHGPAARELSISLVVSHGEREVTLYVSGHAGGYYVTERAVAFSSGRCRLEAMYRWENGSDLPDRAHFVAGIERQFDLIGTRYAEREPAARPIGEREWG